MLELFDGGEQKKNGTYACREKGMPCAAILIELIRSRLVYPWIVLRIRFYSERGSVDNLSLSFLFFTQQNRAAHNRYFRSVHEIAREKEEEEEDRVVEN